VSELEGLLGTPRANDIPRTERFGKGRVPTPSELIQQMNAGLLPTPNAVDATGRQYQYSQGNHDKKVMCLPGVISTSLPAASPASPFLVPEREQERQTIAFSGLRCYESYERLSRHGSSLKTFVASLVSTTAWYSRTVALRWKLSVTMSSHLLYQLAVSARPTGETESGLLHTARTSDAIGGMRPNDGKNRIGSDGTNPGLKLQPAFVEYLMGYPTSWTRLED